MKRKSNYRLQQKEKVSRFTDQISMPAFRYRLREGCLILTFAAALFLILALWSYNPADPSWSHLVDTIHIKNAGGRVGAWISDLMLYLVGYAGYALPLLVIYGAWEGFKRNKRSAFPQWPLFILKILGFFLLLCAMSTFLALEIQPTGNHVPFDSGGILGVVMLKCLLPSFSRLGTLLILFFCLLLGTTLLTGLSWAACFEHIGHFMLIVSSSFYKLLKKIPWNTFFKMPDLSSPPVKSSSPIHKKITPNIVLSSPALQQCAEGSPIRIMKPQVTVSKTPAVHPDKAIFSPTPTPTTQDSWTFPTVSLLDQPKPFLSKKEEDSTLQEKSLAIESQLADFGIQAQVESVHPGPVVTRYELQLAAGTKANKITNLSTDLARSLSVSRVRVVEVIPGKSVIGLELPNPHREPVTLHEVLTSKQYQNSHAALTLALGKDIAGHPFVVDLAKMPHLLLAGTTGSGKSVTLNAILLSLLYKSRPSQLRLILIDPKMLELSVYEQIPHLLTPVVTDMKDAATALRWCVHEMERRYRLMADLGVRNIAGFNLKIKENPQALRQTEEIANSLAQEFPYIVVIADEFADMMAIVGKKIEPLIIRLAQKARAAGIHLIFATQRPSVDVITGLIKANIPTRIAFQTSSKIDSRTILDQAGAEQLLGFGDMLYMTPGSGVPVRVHGAYVSDEEVHRVVRYLKNNNKTDYINLETTDPNAVPSENPNDLIDGEKDALYDMAVDMVLRTRRVSISSVQRRFKIGYNRAARIVEAMEAAGVVGPMGSNGTRDVLSPPPTPSEEDAL